jgi:hypothetical protein
MRRVHKALNQVFSATGTGSSSGSAATIPRIPPVEVAYQGTAITLAAEIDDVAIVIHGEHQIEPTETIRWND